MRITDVEAVVLRQPSIDSTVADGSQDDLIVLVSTDDGAVGVGEVDSSPEVIKAVIDAQPSHANAIGLRHVLVGQDAADIDGLWDQMYRASVYYGRRGPAIHAMSGIEMALWDIKGKAAGVPVCQLLGRPVHDRLKAYASLLMPDTEAQVTETVTGLAEQGFRAVKLGWGIIGQDVDHDIRLVTAAMAAGEGQVEIMVDAGFGYGADVERALRAARAFAELGVTWLEEPFLPDAYPAYAALAAAVDLPIAAGEHEATRWGFEELLDRAQLDIAQPDVTRCGGLMETIRIAQLATERGRRCVTHGWKSGVIKAASLQVNAVLPGARYLEYCVADTELNRGLTVERFPLEEGGMVRVPTASGLGVTLDPEVVARFAASPVRTPIPA
jgi:L-alanine-DL-glutamate epimerase-like enolase superfamily enzyme